MKRIFSLITFLTLLLVAYTNCSQQEDGIQQTSQARSETCSPPPGVSGSPQSVEQAVALMNSLPKPTTISCFIESLSRPLDINATYSTASIQPAVGASSPRIFIIIGPLIMGISPEGAGANLVEFAQIKSYGQTLKAETAFPLYSDQSQASPFKRIQSGNGSTCTGCHAGEHRDTSITYANAYISKALRPFSDFNVTVASLQAERSKCGASNGERCDVLRAIFDHGTVNGRAFPNEVP